MNGRTSFGLLSIALTLGCVGCVTTQSDKNAAASNGSSGGGSLTMPRPDEMPRVVKKDDGPKRQPQAKTEIASGKLMEAEADTETAKASPEAQAQMRDKARKAYQHAIQLEPNNLEAQRCLAGVYAKGGDFERALDIYRKALTKNPRDLKLWYELGLCHHRRKDFAESIRCFNKALEIDPENRDCMKKLGFTLAYTGQLEQGLAYLTRVQGSALAHYNLAQVLLQHKQTDLARQHLNIALRENGQLAEARELLDRIDSNNQAASRGVSE